MSENDSVAAEQFRRTLATFSTGVAVVTTATDNGPVGMTVNSFTSLSLRPPLVLFCIDQNSTRYDHFAQCSYFTVNILREDQTAVSNAFASRTHPNWSEVAYRDSDQEGGCPLLDGTLASIECCRHAIYVEGDHSILIGRALRATRGPAGEPLLYYGGGYRRIKTTVED